MILGKANCLLLDTPFILSRTATEPNTDPEAVNWTREDITWENTDVTWETTTLPEVP